VNNKKEIYKEYLTTKMSEYDLIIKLDSIQAKTVKDDGVIYTPWNIVQSMIELAEPNLDMKIIEPSCGHGAFLIGLLSYMNEKHGLVGEALYKWFIKKVSCVDVSENTIIELKEILSLYFLKHFKLSIKENDFINIYCHDGLTFDNGVCFDLCIGNPPYIRAKNLAPEYLSFLKKNYISCKKGTTDIYLAFIEKYSSTVKNLVFITPNSFLTSNTGVVLKEILKEKLTVLVDFKEKKIFKDANVYTCIFKTDLNSATTKITYGNDLNNLKCISKTEIFNSINNVNGLFDTILSGVATLCDSIYVVKKGKDNKFYATHNGLSYEIEKKMIVPYLKITKIKSDNLSHIDYMLYPYNDNKTVINEEELKTTYPLSYTYLLAVKERLLQRDKGKTEKYESWYAYGRKQGLHKITENLIVVIPKMIGGECKPHRINISNLLSQYGKIVFTSGFVIPQNQENEIACDYLLGEQFIAFAKKTGKAWPGKNESYFSLTSRQMKTFKI
jgi:hypothetical protein